MVEPQPFATKPIRGYHTWSLRASGQTQALSNAYYLPSFKLFVVTDTAAAADAAASFAATAASSPACKARPIEMHGQCCIEK